MIKQTIQNNLIQFPKHLFPKKRMIVKPSLVDNSKLFTMTTKGVALESLGIIDNDVLICQEIKNIKDIKKNSLCIVRIDGEMTARIITPRKDGKAKLKNDLTSNIYYQNEFEIIGEVLQFQRNLGI